MATKTTTKKTQGVAPQVSASQTKQVADAAKAVASLQKQVAAKTGGGNTSVSYSAGNTRTTADGKVTAVPDRISNADQTMSVPAGEIPTAIAETPAVDTAQPSPETANATPFTQPTEVPFEQAQKNLLAGGLQGTELAAAQNNLAQKYQKGLATAQASGTPAPTSGGQAMASMQKMLPPPTPDTANVDMVLAEDPVYSQLLKTYEDYFNPKETQKSLADEYNSLVKKSGIAEINADLINYKNIINGTEQDLRDEITKAGGFASDSAVRALAVVRNKNLIEDYNNLLDTRDALQEHINAQIQLSKEDRAMATQRFNDQIGFLGKISDYRDKAVSNSLSAYNNVISNMGYDGLYASTGGDPYYVNLVEKTLGLAPNSLINLSQQQTLKQQAEARLQGRESRIAGGGGGGVTGVTSGNLEDQFADLKLSAAQKGDLVEIQTLETQMNQLTDLAVDGILEGIGGLGQGTLKQSAFSIFGVGSEEGAQVRTTIGNIKSAIAKLRGGTSFTLNEEKLLDTYVPGINESTASVLAKVAGLRAFLNAKRDAIVQVAGGSAQNDNDPLGLR